MIIIKNKTKDCFARIPNLLLHDDKLKWKDKGLLAYLLSKPEGWNLRIQDVLKRSPDGKDSVYSSLKNLITHGYCKRVEKRDESGQLAGVEYSVSDSPIFNNSDKPHTENPHTENPNISNKDISKTKSLGLNIKPNKEKADAFPWAEVMTIFKNYRPHKKFRKSAKGITERHMKFFWRRNQKSSYCFELLCKKILESDFLMGNGDFIGVFHNPDPQWSWVFDKTAKGEWRADKIMNNEYSNQAMSFLASAPNLTTCFIIGKGALDINTNEKLTDGSPRYTSTGVSDEYTGLDKYIDNK